MRGFIAAILFAAAPAVTAAPTTKPAATQPAARPVVAKPDVESLHAAAVELLRAKNFQKGGQFLEQAYRSKSLTEHSRALILNHAMLDIRQRTNVMRALKDLRDYMRAQPDPDDDAANLMGAALDVAAANEPMRESDLFRSARETLSEQIVRLEESRPGQKKSGNRWYTADQYARLLEKTRDKIERFNAESKLLAELRAERDLLAQKVSNLGTLATHSHRENDPAIVNCILCARRAADERDQKLAQEQGLNMGERISQQEAIVASLAAQLPRASWKIKFVPIDPSANTPPGPNEPSAFAAPAPNLAPPAPASRPALWPKKQ